MEFLQKNRTTLILLAIIGLIFFLIRLPNLLLQPVFADEAIYIRWAQVMRAEPSLRFLPLTDGKTPLFMWMMIPLFKIFEDPLFAGRILSVFSGFATLLGLFGIGWRFFNKRVGLWVALLVTITPFTIFFDRLALVDSMLVAFSVWSLFVALLLIKTPRFDLAMVLGYLLGAGILVKPPGVFSILTLPLTLLTFDFNNKKRLTKFLRIFLLWLISLFIAFAIYNILRLGSGFSSLNTRNQDYVHPLKSLLDTPLDPFMPHFRDLIEWLPKLLTLPIVFFILLGAAISIFKLNKYGLVILGWCIGPLLLEMALLKTFTGRYILFTVVPLLVLAGVAVDEVFIRAKERLNTNLALIALLLIMLPGTIYFTYFIHTNPPQAPLPKEARRGYFEEWTAGYGLKEISEFLGKESRNGMVVVGTEGSFGTLPDGLQIYLDKNRQVVIIGGTATVSAQLRDAAKDHRTFFVANKSRYPIPAEKVIPLKEYPKAVGDKGQDAIVLYEVFPLD